MVDQFVVFQHLNVLGKQLKSLLLCAQLFSIFFLLDLGSRGTRDIWEFSLRFVCSDKDKMSEIAPWSVSDRIENYSDSMKRRSSWKRKYLKVLKHHLIRVLIFIANGTLQRHLSHSMKSIWNETLNTFCQRKIWSEREKELKMWKAFAP